ncbi:MAG: FxsA family protein [Acidimicrobiales bacterium]
MAPVLFLLFLVVPFLELYVILQVGQAIGALNTIAVLIAVSVVGAWLVKREGLGVLRRARERVDRGAVPGRELVDGVLILFAGALLLTPGFLTDLVAVLLLLPPVRAAVRTSATRFLRRRVDLRTFGPGRHL